MHGHHFVNLMSSIIIRIVAFGEYFNTFLLGILESYSLNFCIVMLLQKPMQGVYQIYILKYPLRAGGTSDIHTHKYPLHAGGT